jgi:hypothetical protein
MKFSAAEQQEPVLRSTCSLLGCSAADRQYGPPPLLTIDIN